MKKTLNSRPLIAGAASFTATTLLTSAAALAACAGAPTLVALAGLVGPPSISATESSTDQALELIRRRREEASASCPAGFVRSGGNCVPAASQASVAAVAQAPAPAPVSVTTTTTSGQAAAPASSPSASPGASPAPKQAARRPAATQQVASAPASAPGYGYGGGSIKDEAYVSMPASVRQRGSWIEAYYDEEKRSQLNPAGGPDNNPTRRMVSGGMLAGVDVAEYTSGATVRGFQVGVLGGYNSTRAKFSDTTSVKFQPSLNSTQLTRSTEQRQEIEGGFTGIYGSYVHGKFSMDGAVKVDFFDFDQSSVDTLAAGCNDVFRNFGSTSMTNTTVASNVYYRFDLSSSHYIEPTVGVRYTHIDYGGSASSLGIRDGDVFRIQGGLRLGTTRVTPDGWVWRTAIAGLLYSDVSISGLVVPGGTTFPVVPLVDEGKVRVMGVLENRVDVGAGFTLYNDLEVRGGDNYYGFGARGGIRYQW